MHEETAAAEIAAAEIPDGIDVSMHQGIIDWPRVAAAGVKFAIIKATEGRTYVDPAFARNWLGAKAAGVVRGAYHYLRFDSSGTEQAAHFTATVKLESGDLLPVVDVEDERHGVPNALTVGGFVDRLEKDSGRPCMIYTYPFFWPKLGSPANWCGRPLWLAHYGVETPTMPAPWTDYAIHQYSAQGRIDGIDRDVDLNRLNCNLDFLRWPRVHD